MAPSSSWKDQPIENLIGDATGYTFLTPTRGQCHAWLDELRKVLAALGYRWMIPMALSLEFERGRYVDIVTHQPDNNYDPIFQYVVVALAINAGALLSLPRRSRPLTSRKSCGKNYKYIFESIALFSSKLLKHCKLSFPRLFQHHNPLELPHPLAGLREFADLHRGYNRDVAVVNPSTAWEEASTALRQPLEPTTARITDWINGVDVAVQKLITARVLPASIDGAVCGNVISKLSHFEDQSAQTMRWITRADNFCTRNEQQPYQWRELFDEVHASLAVDRHSADEGEVVAGKKRQKPNLGGPGSAQVFYTLAQLQSAFFLGQQNVAAGTSTPALGTTPGAPPKGGGGGDKGGRKLLCPSCKINHPLGLKSCPDYETKTKQLMEAKSQE